MGYGEDMRKRSLKKEEIEENNVERLKKKKKTERERDERGGLNVCSGKHKVK